MQSYILAIDQSTSGTKAMLLDKNGVVTERCDYSHRQIIDQNGYIEHDPKEIYSNLLCAVRDVLKQSGVSPKEIACAALSNQRETALVWDKTTGEPIYNAIVWQCARGEEICRRIDKAGGADLIKRATGIPLSPYYSAAKIAWILENALPGRHRPQDICCSTMDSWLVYKLCGGTPKTDYSNASRTQLFDLHTLSWSDAVCDLFGIDPAMLPEVCDSDSLFGYSNFEEIFAEPIPIYSVLGDSHGALFGQGCLKSGMIKATYGTGSSIMMNIGESPILSEKGVVTSLAWRIGGTTQYVLEGNINYTGAVIKWLVEDMQLISSPNEAGKLSETVAHIDGLYLVPAFSGLGAPYWNDKARGVLCGLVRGVGKANVVRAAEECIAYQITDILQVMQQETSMDIEVLRVDGGPTADSFLMQFQADISRCNVQVAALEELSGAGAAYAAGIAMGFYEKDIVMRNSPKKLYTPMLQAEVRDNWYAEWKAAVQTVLSNA